MPSPFRLPPPDMEFVHGYPGIPPYLSRPLASVRGIVQLRSESKLVQAGWVKIELRKIETLPGGGQWNTYIDSVGESPITLWQAKNKWDEIRSKDLPFQIPVPESIPPSLALERDAGIKYELVATVLTKGEKYDPSPPVPGATLIA
ncbi:hypothetical protein FRC01_005205 [Tulasnella sp. 417]|nr:hypothetical protein FRC01_005205 [Tulasnella sp. 417]